MRATEERSDGEAFLAFVVGEERVRDSFLLAQMTLAAKRSVLNSPVPFTIRDEIDLHKALLTYVDACISIISTLQKRTALPYQTFPDCHTVLREFRDRNHHNGYVAFRPIDTPIGRDFFVWPMTFISGIAPGQREAGEEENPYLLLSTLIEGNHAYIMGLVDEQREFFYENGRPRFMLRAEYVCPAAVGGRYQPLAPESAAPSSDAALPTAAKKAN